MNVKIEIRKIEIAEDPPRTELRYFLIIWDEGATISDAYDLDREEIVFLKEATKEMLDGEPNETSLHLGDRFSWIKRNEYDVLSFRVSASEGCMYRGYYFDYRSAKFLISRIENALEQEI